MHLISMSKPTLAVIPVAAIVSTVMAGVGTAGVSVAAARPPRLGEQLNTSFGGCEAPPCGTALSSFDDVTAYSNGDCNCKGCSCGGTGATGLRYQCVELAQRFFHEKHGIAPIWPIAYAKQMCSNRPSGVHLTSSPAPGDLMVLGWEPYGHVTVITSVGSGYVDVIEQNNMPTGRNRYPISEAECFLTAGPTPPTQGCHAAGWYCGGDDIPGDPNTLYFCNAPGGHIVKTQPCDTTCVVAASGINDYCDRMSSSCAGIANGNYCGSDGPHGNGSILYRCMDQKHQGAWYCTKGCHVVPHANDVCA